MKFIKDDIIIPSEQVYPNGALVVDGYEADGTLLAHPLGGGLQYRLNPGAEGAFRAVPPREAESPLWRRARFVLEGSDAVFDGWTCGRVWNGWEKPCFELSEAKRIIEEFPAFNGTFDAESDCFITRIKGEEDEVWKGEDVTLLGGTRIRLYGVGAGSWIWEEAEAGS